MMVNYCSTCNLLNAPTLICAPLPLSQPFLGVCINPMSPEAVSSLQKYKDLPSKCPDCQAYKVPVTATSNSTCADWICPFCCPSKSDLMPRGQNEMIFDYVEPSADTSGGQPLTNIIALDLCVEHGTNIGGDAFINRRDAIVNALVSLKDRLDSQVDDVRLALVPYAAHPSIVRMECNTQTANSVHAYVHPKSSSRDISTRLIKDSDNAWSASFSLSVDFVVGAVSSMKARDGQPHLDSVRTDVLRHVRAIDAALAMLEGEALARRQCTGTLTAPQVQETMTHMRKQETTKAQVIVFAAAFGHMYGDGPDLTNEELNAIAQNIIEKCAHSSQVHLAINVVLVAPQDGVGDACFAFFQKIASGTGGLFFTHATAGAACLESISSILSRRAVESDASIISARCSSKLRIVKALQQNDLQPKSFKPTNIWSSRCDNPTYSTRSISLLLHRIDTGQQRKVTDEDIDIIQVAWRFTSLQVPNGWHTQRIVTARLSRLSDSLDWIDASVLVAKSVMKQALDANASAVRVNAELLRRQVRSQLRELALALHPKSESKKWWFGASKAILGREALPLAHSAHWLFFQALSVNGPLRRVAFFESLLSAPLAIARRMCFPELYAVLPPTRTLATSSLDSTDLRGLGGPPVECLLVPAVDVGPVVSLGVVLDVGNVLYTWLNVDLLSSYSASSVTVDRIKGACTSTALGIARSRWPTPDVVHLQADGLGVLVPRLMALSEEELEGSKLQGGLSRLLAGLSATQVAAAARTVREVSKEIPPLLSWLRDDADVSINF
jgi:hypothetical protein